MQGSPRHAPGLPLSTQIPTGPGASHQDPGTLKSRVGKLDIFSILVLLVTSIFNIRRLGDLLWRNNEMISRAALFKGAVGVHRYSGGEAGHQSHRRLAPPEARGRPFFRALAGHPHLGAAGGQEGGQLSGGTQSSDGKSRDGRTPSGQHSAAGPGGSRAAATAQPPVSPASSVLSQTHRLRPPRPPCAAAGQERPTVTSDK